MAGVRYGHSALVTERELDIILKCNVFLKGNVWYMSNWEADSEYIF